MQKSNHNNTYPKTKFYLGEFQKIVTLLLPDNRFFDIGIAVIVADSGFLCSLPLRDKCLITSKLYIVIYIIPVDLVKDDINCQKVVSMLDRLTSQSFQPLYLNIISNKKQHNISISVKYLDIAFVASSNRIHFNFLNISYNFF